MDNSNIQDNQNTNQTPEKVRNKGGRPRKTPPPPETQDLITLSTRVISDELNRIRKAQLTNPLEPLSSADSRQVAEFLKTLISLQKEERAARQELLKDFQNDQIDLDDLLDELTKERKKYKSNKKYVRKKKDVMSQEGEDNGS